MSVSYRRVKHLAGRKDITDEGIRELCKKGWFINQIRGHFKVGLLRVRKIMREYEATL